MTRLRLLPTILAIIFFFIILYIFPLSGILGLAFAIGFSIIFYLILNRWLPSGQAATAGRNAMSNDLQLQGVVRGFKESRQPASGFFHPAMKAPDLIVWTFQLERHSETEERLDPIPVEMCGKNFSGFINEGNVVRLYEKSWQGGFVRTKRVYNVTFKEDIKAHG